MKVTGFINMFRNRAKRESLYTKAEFWDSKAESLRGDAISMWPNNNLNRLYHNEQMRLVDSVSENIAGARVLDVGCGTGRLSRFLAEKGAIVTGVDFSEKAIEVARSESVGQDITYIVDSVFNIDMNQEYDFIFMWGCVTVAAKNADELYSVMTNINRALKSTGQFLLLEPIHQGILHRVLNLDIEAFKSIMVAVGFDIVWVKQMHFWPARLALAFIAWPNFITSPIYHIGQLLMRVPGLNKLGDYKAVLSSSKR